MKNAVFWYVMTECDSCQQRRFGGTYFLHLQGEDEAMISSEMSVLTRNVQRYYIPEDGVLQLSTLYTEICR
jgi:hypothetical protein